MASVRARGPATLMAVRKEQLDHLLTTSLPATRAMFYAVLARWRATESMLRQGEKMAQLGTLTAGVAHELNNPAAAVKRSSDQIAQAVERYASAQAALANAGLSGSQRQAIDAEAARASAIAARPPDLDGLTRSDREFAVEGWLQAHGVIEPWELSPSLVSAGCEPEKLDTLTAQLTPAQVPAAMDFIASSYAVHGLLAEIGHGAGRISEIVKALKSYSYLDQAPVQEVDVHEGIDDTLLILGGKLGSGINSGIKVRREYAEGLPRIPAYGSELNQVWTNLIDNAADALDGQGTIVLRTRAEDNWVVVEVEDDGTSIAPEVLSRVFDAFFTTKPPGKGTGMGLDITYNIVVYKHRGDIQVTSEPGKTVFTVRLPVSA